MRSEAVTIELYGVPRILAGQRSLEVPGGTLGELAAGLIDRCPALGDAVVDRSTGWLRNGYTFVVDERFSRDPTIAVPPGAAVLLVASVAGG